MIITCRFHIDEDHIVWAAYKLLMRGEKLSKKSVLEYLKAQIEQFGISDEFLLGYEYSTGDGIDERLHDKAVEWVRSRKWDT